MVININCHDECAVLTYSDDTWWRIKPFWCGGKSMAEFLRFAVGPFPLLPPSLLLSLWLWLLMVVAGAWQVELVPLNERSCPHGCGAKWALTNALHPAWGEWKVRFVFQIIIKVLSFFLQNNLEHTLAYSILQEQCFMHGLEKNFPLVSYQCTHTYIHIHLMMHGN